MLHRCLSTPVFGIADDGDYVTLGKALAEGQGYRLISLPQSIVETKYPPLFPLVLSLIWKVAPRFPENLPFLKMVPVVAGVAWLWLSWIFLRGSGFSKSETFFVAFFVAASPWCLFLSSTVMSETMFGVLVFASLIYLSCGRMMLALAFATAAYFTRSAGVALFGGLAIHLLIHRRWKALAITVAVAGVSVGLWTAWQSQALPPLTGIESWYTAQNYQNGSIFSPRFTSSERLRILYKNAEHLFNSPRTDFLVLFDWEGILISALVWVLFVRGLLRRRQLWITLPFLACYTALVLSYAGTPPDRLLLPVLPLIVAGFAAGLPQNRKWLVAVTFLVLAIPVPLYVAGALEP